MAFAREKRHTRRYHFGHLSRIDCILGSLNGILINHGCHPGASRGFLGQQSQLLRFEGLIVNVRICQTATEAVV
jgi:hypothetical protein